MKSQFQLFRVVHWAVQIRLIPISSLEPPYISEVFSSFTLLLSASEVAGRCVCGGGRRGEGGGGSYSFVACLSHLTIHHSSLHPF